MTDASHVRWLEVARWFHAVRGELDGLWYQNRNSRISTCGIPAGCWPRGFANGSTIRVVQCFLVIWGPRQVLDNTEQFKTTFQHLSDNLFDACTIRTLRTIDLHKYHIYGTWAWQIIGYMRTDVELKSWKQNLKDILLLGCTCWSSKLTFDWRFAFWLRKSQPHWGSRWLEDYEKCDLHRCTLFSRVEGRRTKIYLLMVPILWELHVGKECKDLTRVGHVIIRPHWGELLHRVPSQPTGHATHRWWGRCLTLLAMFKEFCATCRH